jgi:hypothetical protein
LKGKISSFSGADHINVRGGQVPFSKTLQSLQFGHGLIKLAGNGGFIAENFIQHFQCGQSQARPNLKEIYFFRQIFAIMPPTSKFGYKKPLF